MKTFICVDCGCSYDHEPYETETLMLCRTCKQRRKLYMETEQILLIADQILPGASHNIGLLMMGPFIMADILRRIRCEEKLECVHDILWLDEGNGHVCGECRICGETFNEYSPEFQERSDPRIY